MHICMSLDGKHEHSFKNLKIAVAASQLAHQSQEPTKREVEGIGRD